MRKAALPVVPIRDMGGSGCAPKIMEIFVFWLTGRQDEMGAAQDIQLILRSYWDKYNDDVALQEDC